MVTAAGDTTTGLGHRGRVRRIAAAGLMVVAAMGSAPLGCAHTRAGQAPASMAGLEVPDWVSRGSGAQQADGQKVFYGVGSVHGIRNPSLARTTADNRARAEIGKIFSIYSASLMQDFAAAQSAEAAGDGSAAVTAPELLNVEQTIKTFSMTTLMGVQVVDHWYHPSDGSVYALARLDLANFVDKTAQLPQASEQMRQFVQAHAQKAFEKLEQQENNASGTAGVVPVDQNEI